MDNGNIIIGRESVETEEDVWIEEPLLMSHDMRKIHLSKIPKDMIAYSYVEEDPNTIDLYYEKLREYKLIQG